MKIGIICCLHGNEKYGLEVIKKLPSHIPFFIGNKKAVIENKRFIESDLNRAFPGKKEGSHEEKIATELLKKLKNFDYVIDLHSSSNDCPLFGIITKPNKKKIELARKLGLNKLVIMPDYFAKGNSLIDFVKCGISLEVGPHQNTKNVNEVAEKINNFIHENNLAYNLEIFEVFGIIKKENSNVLIKNFENVKEGQIISLGKNNKKQYAKSDFTAILVNEDSYRDILCLAAKQDTHNLTSHLYS